MANIAKKNLKTPETMEYTVLFNTDKDKEKYIKRLEKMIRSSLEYRDYINFLKEYVDMNKCAFFNNVQNDESTKVRIEIHHDPLTLFDIVKIVVNKFIDDGIPLNDFYISDEVMRLHYENQVGLIPLSKTIHQLVHNSNDIFIPLNLIYGDYSKFIEDYYDYLEPEMLFKIETKVSQSKNVQKEQFEKILNPEFTYVNVEGFELPRKMQYSETKDIAQ